MDEGKAAWAYVASLQGDKESSMIKILFFSCLLVVAQLAVAEERADCSRAMTQLEMNECAATDFELADSDLNKVYNAIVKSQREDRRFIQKLRAAQRAWLAFRDAEVEATFACEFEDARRCHGSMMPMLVSALKTKLTRERIERLRELARERGCPGCG